MAPPFFPDQSTVLVTLAAVIPASEHAPVDLYSMVQSNGGDADGYEFDMVWAPKRLLKWIEYDIMG
jgi:hypothetical protein